MKKIYEAPILLASNGSISLTVSQLGALGFDDPAEFIAFWNENVENIIEEFKTFNPLDKSTWDAAIAAGFDEDVPDTWYILIGIPID